MPATGASLFDVGLDKRCTMVKEAFNSLPPLKSICIACLSFSCGAQAPHVEIDRADLSTAMSKVIALVCSWKRPPGTHTQRVPGAAVAKGSTLLLSAVGSSGPRCAYSSSNEAPRSSQIWRAKIIHQVPTLPKSRAGSSKPQHLRRRMNS